MRSFVFVLVIAMQAVCSLGHAQSPSAPPPPATQEELDRQLAKIFADDAIPGASVALVENGQITFVKGYGSADLAKATPVTADTVFRAASISKSLTGIAIMTAVQEGRLALDGRLKELAPEVKFDNPWEATDPVRLVHLIEHTTGWPDISLRILTMEGKGWPLLRGVQESSAQFVSRWKPGRFSVYNNAGPGVAGVILEKASGQDFNTYMRARVLRPMGIAIGDFELTPEIAPNLSKSYGSDRAETPFQNIVLGPSGSLNVSARELAQLVRFYLGRGTVDGTQILTPESVARIERGESTLAAGVGFAPYGYGLGNTPISDRSVFRGHNGGIDSFTSVYGYALSANSGFVLMANGGAGVDFATPASRLIQAYLVRNAAPVSEPIVAVDQAQLEKYAGVYRVVTPSNTLSAPYQAVLGLTWIQADKGKLSIGGRTYVPTSPHTFRREDRVATTIAFAEDQEGIFRVSAFNTMQKEPLWRAAVIVGVLAALALGVVVTILMAPVWLVSWALGRLSTRGGALVRFLPLLAVIALLATFGMPFSYLGTGSIPAALQLAEPGPYAYAILACSVLFPVIAALGLLRALTASEVSLLVRLYAVLTSIAILAFGAFAASIGWVPAQTWVM